MLKKNLREELLVDLYHSHHSNGGWLPDLQKFYNLSIHEVRWLEKYDDKIIKINKQNKEPDLLEFVRDNKKEYKDSRLEYLEKVKQTYKELDTTNKRLINKLDDNEDASWLVDVIKDLPGYIDTSKKLRILRYEMKALNNKAPKSKITDFDIEMAKKVKMTSLIKCERAGTYFRAVCPFHNEKNASFVIYPTNTAYCFACQVRVDPISFIRKLNNLTFVEAVKFLN